MLKIVDVSKKQRIYLKSAPHYILKLIITQLEFKLGLGLLEIYWKAPKTNLNPNSTLNP